MVGWTPMPAKALPDTLLLLATLLFALGPSRRIPSSSLPVQPPLPQPPLPGMLFPSTVLFLIWLASESSTTEIPPKGPLWETRFVVMVLPSELNMAMPSPRSHAPSRRSLKLSRTVMFVTVLPEPPKMATPASKPETVPPLTVTPFTLTRRIPAWSPGPVLPVILKPFRLRVTLEAVITRPSVPVQALTLAVRVVFWVMWVPQARPAALAGAA